MARSSNKCGRISPAATKALHPYPVAGAVNAVWRQVEGRVNSDLRGDCDAEAALALWRARARLEALPQEERPAYATVCVRRALRQFLQRELEQRAGTIPLEDSLAWKHEAGQRHEASAEWVALLRDTLLEQIGRATLAEALRALPPRDYAILDLFYCQALGDAEIARRLNRSPEAVKKQRQRAILALRQALRADHSES